jgi:hypothetical protein
MPQSRYDPHGAAVFIEQAIRSTAIRRGKSEAWAREQLRSFFQEVLERAEREDRPIEEVVRAMRPRMRWRMYGYGLRVGGYGCLAVVYLFWSAGLLVLSGAVLFGMLRGCVAG